MNSLEQLKQYTTVVADTGDFQTIQAYEPQDATTNPSLILKAIGKPEYDSVIEQAISDATGSNGNAGLESVIDHLLVRFGIEILKIVPGRVSTEVDARLSFNVTGSIEKAKELLRYRSVPAKQIGQEIGFSDPNYFYLVFKRMTGMTVTDYLDQKGTEERR